MALDDVRLNVTEPGVQRIAPPARRGDGIAEAVSAFGEIGGDIRKGALLAEQKQQLGQVVDEVTFLNRQELTEEGELDFDPAVAPTSGAKGRFSRLRTARKQGKISEARLRIETESVLKESINAAPGFAEEFRNQARSILNFDPTGATIQALIELSTDAPEQRRNAFLDSINDKAEAFVLRGIPFPIGQAFLIEAAMSEVKAGIIGDRIKTGDIDTPKIVSESVDAFRNFAAETFADAMGQIKVAGGVLNTEQLIGDLQLKAAELIADKQFNMSNPDPGIVYTQAQINRIPEAIERQMALMSDALNNNDLVELMKKRTDGVATALTMFGLETFPVLNVLQKAGGQGAVDWYLRMAKLAGDNPRIKKTLMQIPAFANADALSQNRDRINAVTRMMFGDLAYPLNLSEADQALLDGLSGGAITDADPSTFEVGLMARMQQGDKPVQSLSILGQRENSWGDLTPKARSETRAVMTDLQRASASKLVQAISGSDWLMGFEDDKFVLINRRGETFDPSRDIMEGSTVLPIPPGMDTIDRLNKGVLAVLQSDPRWLQDQGLSDQQFVEGLLLVVNSRVVATEGLTNPELGETTQGTERQVDQEALARMREATSLEELFKEVEAAGLGDFSKFQLNRMEDGFFTDGNDVIEIRNGKQFRNGQPVE